MTTWISALAGKLVQQRFNPEKRGGVLYFHRVLPEPNAFYPDDITAKELYALLTHLHTMFDIVPLEALCLNPSVEYGKPRLAIAFDDGYADNLTLGLPVLQETKTPATVFVATAGLDQGILWQDVAVLMGQHLSEPLWMDALWSTGVSGSDSRTDETFRLQAALKRFTLSDRNEWLTVWRRLLASHLQDESPLMLNRAQLREMSSDPLIDIGAHTHDHAILTTLSDDEAVCQIALSRDILKKVIGQVPSLFCYPNGEPGKDQTVKHAEMVKCAGFSAALGTHDGGVDESTDRFMLPRFLPYRRNPLLRALSTMKISGEVA